MQATQASNDVPARHDPARLRRPTTPLTGRGHPIGLGADLSVTTAEPATEVIPVAAGAPARVVTTPPTDLLPSLRRLADGSRPPTPEGSLLPFGWGDVAWRLNPYPAHYRPALACSLVLYPLAHGIPLRFTAPCGKPTGLPRCTDVAEWGRSQLSAGGSTSAPQEFAACGPDHVPFGPGASASMAV